MYSSLFAIEQLPIDYTGEKKRKEPLTVNLSGAKCFQRVPLDASVTLDPVSNHSAWGQWLQNISDLGIVIAAAWGKIRNSFKICGVIFGHNTAY
jgi:hypothetical protein